MLSYQRPAVACIPVGQLCGDDGYLIAAAFTVVAYKSSEKLAVKRGVLGYGSISVALALINDHRFEFQLECGRGQVSVACQRKSRHKYQRGYGFTVHSDLIFPLSCQIYYGAACHYTETLALGPAAVSVFNVQLYCHTVRAPFQHALGYLIISGRIEIFRFAHGNTVDVGFVRIYQSAQYQHGVIKVSVLAHLEFSHEPDASAECFSCQVIDPQRYLAGLAAVISACDHLLAYLITFFQIICPFVLVLFVCSFHVLTVARCSYSVDQRIKLGEFPEYLHGESSVDG